MTRRITIAKVYMWVNGYFSEHNPQTGAANWVLTNADPQ